MRLRQFARTTAFVPYFLGYGTTGAALALVALVLVAESTGIGGESTVVEETFATVVFFAALAAGFALAVLLAWRARANGFAQAGWAVFGCMNAWLGMSEGNRVFIEAELHAPQTILDGVATVVRGLLWYLFAIVGGATALGGAAGLVLNLKWLNADG